MGFKGLILLSLFSLASIAATIDDCRRDSKTVAKDENSHEEKDGPFEFTATLVDGVLYLTIISKSNRGTASFNVDDHIKKTIEKFTTPARVVDFQRVGPRFFGGRVKSVQIVLGGVPPRELDSYGRVVAIDPILEDFNNAMAEAAKKDKKIQEALNHGKKITDPDIQKRLHWLAIQKTSLEPIRHSGLLGEDEILVSGEKRDRNGNYKEVTITIKPSPNRRF